MDCLKKQKFNQGSTLIWVMVTTLVLTIVLAICLTIVSQQHTKAVNTHLRNQAYYTALSTTQTIEAWIKNGDADAQSFISALATPGAEKVINFAESDLPANTGSCDVTVKNVKAITDVGDKLKITSTAIYQNSTETVSVVIEKNPSNIGGNFGYPVSGFNPDAEYGAKVKAITDGTDDPVTGGSYVTDSNPVNIAFNAPNGSNIRSGLWGDSSATVKRDWNPENRTKINNIISDTSSKREVTWMETSDIGGENYTSGPRDNPYIDYRNTTTAKGPNAKMML
jgi:Tfp pilus assembly protein PilX